MQTPGYWMDEASGVLAPVVQKYFTGAELSEDELDIMRQYLRQWVRSPLWDTNPHLDDETSRILAELRNRKVTTQKELNEWVFDMVGHGMDPL